MSDEFQSVIEGNCALSLESRLIFRLTGEDRIRFFNGQATQDITKCAEGVALQCAICSAKGKLQAEAVVARSGNALFIDFPSDLEETFPSRIERYIIADDVEMSEVSSPAGAVHFFGEIPPDLNDEWTICESNRFRRKGWDCWSHTSGNEALPFPVASPAIAEQCRIEFFAPAWGKDIEPDSLAPEFFSENHAIRYDKGCYIGQEVIARIKSRGRVNRKCCQLEGNSVIQGLPVRIVSEEEKEIGVLTSGQQVPGSEGTIKAIATLQHPWNEPGTELTVQGSIWKVVQAV